jgi:hypothetical protein
MVCGTPAPQLGRGHQPGLSVESVAPVGRRESVFVPPETKHDQERTAAVVHHTVCRNSHSGVDGPLPVGQSGPQRIVMARHPTPRRAQLTGAVHRAGTRPQRAR